MRTLAFISFLFFIFCPLLINSQTSCPRGTFSANGTDTPNACTNCPEGFFQDNLGAIECKSCEIGKYSDATGSENCTSCPIGTTTINKGANSLSQCVPINNIPTLSQWGLIILALCFMIVGIAITSRVRV